MSTPNFCYKNRCVVITSEDFEDGNIPHCETKQLDSNRYYPSYPLYEQPDCVILVAVLTGAYYEGACLDFYVHPDFETEMTEKQYEKQLRVEMRVMNKFLDGLKEEFGYEEYRCVAVFSNGEAIYESIN